MQPTKRRTVRFANRRLISLLSFASIGKNQMAGATSSSDNMVTDHGEMMDTVQDEKKTAIDSSLPGFFAKELSRFMPPEASTNPATPETSTKPAATETDSVSMAKVQVTLAATSAAERGREDRDFPVGRAQQAVELLPVDLAPTAVATAVAADAATTTFATNAAGETTTGPNAKNCVINDVEETNTVQEEETRKDTSKPFSPVECSAKKLSQEIITPSSTPLVTPAMNDLVEEMKAVPGAGAKEIVTSRPPSLANCLTTTLCQRTVTSSTALITSPTAEPQATDLGSASILEQTPPASPPQDTTSPVRSARKGEQTPPLSPPQDVSTPSMLAGISEQKRLAPPPPNIAAALARVAEQQIPPASAPP